MTTKTKTRKGAIEKVVESAADAAEELGAAAVAFKESWNHVRKARAKAKPATTVATRMTKKAVRATTRGVAKMRGVTSKNKKVKSRRK